MSASFPVRHVVRCPLCYDGAKPQHLGRGVFVCECCGAHYRVLKAALPAPTMLSVQSECPRCAAARERDRSIAQGYLQPSAEMPGQLVCNSCGEHFSPGRAA